MCKSVCEIYEYSGVDEYGDMCQSFENVDVDDDVDDHYDGFFIDCIAKSCTNVRNSEAFAELNVLHAGSNSTVNCKLDTGSQVNVLPINVFRRMQVSRPLRPAKKSFRVRGFPT